MFKQFHAAHRSHVSTFPWGSKLWWNSAIPASIVKMTLGHTFPGFNNLSRLRLIHLAEWAKCACPSGSGDQVFVEMLPPVVAFTFLVWCPASLTDYWCQPPSSSQFNTTYKTPQHDML